MNIGRSRRDGQVVDQDGLGCSPGPCGEGPDVGIVSCKIGDLQIHNLDWIGQACEIGTESPGIAIPGDDCGSTQASSIRHRPALKEEKVGVIGVVGCHIQSSLAGSVIVGIKFN